MKKKISQFFQNPYAYLIENCYAIMHDKKQFFSTLIIIAGVSFLIHVANTMNNMWDFDKHFLQRMLTDCIMFAVFPLFAFGTWKIYGFHAKIHQYYQVFTSSLLGYVIFLIPSILSGILKFFSLWSERVSSFLGSFAGLLFLVFLAWFCYTYTQWLRLITRTTWLMAIASFMCSLVFYVAFVMLLGYILLSYTWFWA
jgi:membrane-bound metal-dependent hydrolase YbcI (DUF457 family)